MNPFNERNSKPASARKQFQPVALGRETRGLISFDQRTYREPPSAPSGTAEGCRFWEAAGEGLD